MTIRTHPRGGRLTADRRARVLSGIAVAALSAVVLAGCSGSGGDASGKTEITFTYATGDDSWNAAVEAVADAFNEQSDDVVVTPEPLTGSGDYATALKTMDATGDWPAIIDMRDTQTYIDAGKLAAIPSDVTDLVDPEAYAESADGSVYILPSTALNGEIGLNIVYDKDYFDENGLSVPETYDDFVQLLADIQANGDEPLATAAGEVWPSDQLWKPIAAQLFARYSDAGGYWQAVADGDASIDELSDPLQRLLDITDDYVLDGWQSTTDAQTTTLLVNHQAVMATSSAGIGRLNDINKVDPDFNAGLFIIPSDDGKINVVKNSVNGDTAAGLAISQQAADDEDQYAAAIEFLQYYYSVDGANVLEQAGVIAPNIVAADEITRNTEIPGADDYFALLENPNLVWISNETPWSGFSTFNTYFRQARIAMQDGQTGLEDTLAQVKTEFEKDIAEG